jgi:uncharacterized membrane-anchored protein YhcB (DUF1043 family)
MNIEQRIYLGLVFMYVFGLVVGYVFARLTK